MTWVRFRKTIDEIEIVMRHENQKQQPEGFEFSEQRASKDPTCSDPLSPWLLK